MTIAEKITRAKADYDAVYEAGKQAGGDNYYDTFWDLYQQNGNRKNYEYAFGGNGWTDETFKPKYDIIPLTVLKTFSKSQIKDVKKALEDAGVRFDLSKAAIHSYFIDDYPLTERRPTLNVTSATSLNYFIYNCLYLKYIGDI